MRKVALLMALLLCVLPITANAATMRFVGIRPELTFDGTTANCSVDITGDSMSDKIAVTVTLCEGSTWIASWNDSGTGYLHFSKNKTVTRGKTYTLTADATINGVKQQTVSITGKCE